MPLMDYQVSTRISLEDPPFRAIIMAAIRKADSDNLERLQRAFPLIFEEFKRRYNAPGGLLPGDPVFDAERLHQQAVEEGFYDGREDQVMYYSDLTAFGQFLVRHPRLIPAGVALVTGPLYVLQAVWETLKEVWEDCSYELRVLREMSEEYHA